MRNPAVTVSVECGSMRRSRSQHVVRAAGLGVVLLSLHWAAGCASEPPSAVTAVEQDFGPIVVIAPGFDPIGMDGLENVLALTPGVLSGGEPRGDAGYASLRDLGVRTVISVDAVPPDAEAARRSGIRVIHLPIGYDAVPEETRRAMARALLEADGPVYVHCHHGKHRGPAAVAAGAVCAGMIGPDEALSFMQAAGTSHAYTGLWRDTETARPEDPFALLAADIDLPERADVGGYAGAMSLISRAHDRVKLVAANDWRVPDDHPDLAPRSDLGLIHDLLRSLEDDAESLAYGPEHARMLRESVDAAVAAERDFDAGNLRALAVSFKGLAASCNACHAAYRD